MEHIVAVLAQAGERVSPAPGILFSVCCLAAGIAFFVFWLWTLIDCVKNEPSDGNDKLIWILVIVFLGFIGAFIYLIVRRPQRIRTLGK